MADTVAVVAQRIGAKVVCYELTWDQDVATASTELTVDVELALGSSSAAIIKVVTDPGAATPTSNYDVELLDFKGVDVFGGKVLNCHASTTEAWIPYYGATVTADPPALPANSTSNYYQLHLSGLTSEQNEDGIILIWVAM